MTAFLKLKNFPVGPAAIFVAIALCLGTGGFFYYDHQKRQITDGKHSELTAIAQLKVHEISRWILERKGDGLVITENPMIGRHVQTLLKHPEDRNVAEETRSWLKSLKEHYDYSEVVLMDTEGNALLSVPDGRTTSPDIIRYFPHAISSKKPLFLDLHVNLQFDPQHKDDSSRIRCGLLVPIATEQHGAGPVVAMLKLIIDPSEFLFQLVQSWPTPTLTAESLLVRRDGDHVLYLNELRHNKDAALLLKRSVHEPQLPAALAASGREGLVEGIDYRGEPVLAVIRTVPDSPWFLVAKVDQAEIYASIHQRGLAVTLLVTILIICAGACLVMIWHYQRAEFYRKQYQLELERLSLVERYEFVMRYANDTIMLADSEGHIKEVNERAVAAYGFTREEFLRMNIRDVRAPEHLGDLPEQWRRIRSENGLVFETIHCRKDGSRFPVEISARIIQLGGIEYYCGTIRDISERKQAERALRRAHDGLEIKVAERTQELTRLNEQLKTEISDRIRVEEALRESEGQLRLLSSRLLTIQEEERKRIARELHDSIGSTLSTIKFGLESNIQSVKHVSFTCESFVTLVSLCQQTIDEVRRIMTDLRPSMLDDLGLVATVGWLSRQFQLIYPSIDVEKSIALDEREIPESLKIVIVRLIQEAFHNIAKHSGAELVNLSLLKSDRRIELSIEDSGEGFNPDAFKGETDRQKGLGLSGMRERTELSGGSFSVESAMGKGTVIRASWPSDR